MINNIQNSFSIQDFEVLSGIKAHTIRIWEKRYALLNPARLNRSIRVYSLRDLQKLLNVSLLQKHGNKISALSKLTDEELENKAKLISAEELPDNYSINSLIISMFSFDDELFEETYKSQSETLSFSEIFVGTYVPLLKHIGLLWQTNGIRPAQEHFISSLIYQKITLNIAGLSNKRSNLNRVNVLFLPKGEVHEIGLLFMVYHLKLSGEKTIYLGRDIPTNDLVEINAKFKEINWITSFVIDRKKEEKEEFIVEMEQLVENTKNTCWVIGGVWKDYKETNKRGQITFYEGFHQLI